MSITLKDKINALNACQRAKVERRTAQLMAEELSLQQLRRAHKLTQASVAKSLGIGQDSVARLEQRSDFLLSTLRHYIESMGGKLQLVAEFPNRKPVILSSLTTESSHSPSQQTRKRAAHA